MMTSDTFGALDAGALERLLDGDLAQFVGRQTGECPVEGADRRPRGADDDDVVLHGNTPVSWRDPSIARPKRGRKSLQARPHATECPA